jgi:hypothetical protein
VWLRLRNYTKRAVRLISVSHISNPHVGVQIPGLIRYALCFFLLLTQWNQNPVSLRSKLAIARGYPDLSFVQTQSACMGSDSRAYLLRVVLFLIANSMESEPPRAVRLISVLHLFIRT